ncbi:hypothetical protein EF808_00805 [archaeon]|nr:MAG: hypothetical protein EF808_00805 [archaeon]
MNEYQVMETRLVELLHLSRCPVGVKFLDSKNTNNYKDLLESSKRVRYCQALMLAGKGERIVLSKDKIACPAASAAFGFAPLTEALESGKMLHTLGLFESIESSRELMAKMPRLVAGAYDAVLLSPLGCMVEDPDIVVLESQPEHLMWVALASIYTTGERMKFSTGVFQATCVDATVVPFRDHKLNASLGCYGCRDSTDIGKDEVLVGFPYCSTIPIIRALEQLSTKPMKRVREKTALKHLNKC